MTAREYKEFMSNRNNIHNCENCPENKGFGKRDYDDRWPCLQYHCWVALTAQKGCRMTPCDNCIEIECEVNGYVCPLYEKYQELREKENEKT
jgi:hypothetical protein